ncbi:MAG: recombination mediator RecR [Gemmatimonadota bacterium]|nr:recombination mediator RecR [Gemmatimonadota bacterium]
MAQLSSQAIATLIDELARLPGVGKKTAQRFAFHLLRVPSDRVLALSDAIRAIKEKVKYCAACWNFTESDVCEFCTDPRRDHSMICVVEQPNDVPVIEKTGQYRGLYHILHGALSPMDGIHAEDLRIQDLVERLDDMVQEVVIATNPNIEGNVTAQYLARLIKPLNIRVTRPAQGLPMGGDLEYADEVTISRAFEGRTEL